MKPKNALLSVLALALLVLLAGCNGVLGLFGDSGGSSGGRRTFWASDFTTGDFYEVTAERLAESDHAIIYAEVGGGVSTLTAQSVAAEFDTRIYDMIRTNFALESDVDNNGKVIFLLLDIRDGFSGSGGYVAGYFHGHHALDLQNSNRADMLFMDIYPGTANDQTFRETMAHEFQHLVNFAEEFIRGGGGQQDVWVNEGLSSAAEYLYAGGHIQNKVDYYNQDPAGTIAQGQGFLTWGAWGDPLVDYATVYLFFQWLRIHASNDTGVYWDVLHNQYTDYRAVLEAYQGRVGSTGDSWETVISNWYFANLLGESGGLRGYGGEIAPAAPFLTDRSNYSSDISGKTFPLYPGEGIFLRPGSSPYSENPPSNLRYFGIDTGQTPPVVDDNGSGGYSGDTLVMVNIRGEDSTTLRTDTDNLPAASITAQSGLSSSSVPATPEIYPIDLRYTLSGGLATENRRASKLD